MDIWVNNAFAQGFAPIDQISVAAFHQSFNVNVLGSVLTIQEALKLFGGKGALSKELGSKNVRINSILLGATETEGATSAGVTKESDYEKMFIANTPLGRRGQPEDIAKAAVFLASDDAAWITGEQISVSGGMYGF